MSRTSARPREVLILLFSFVVTTPYHLNLAATMARDPMVSVGRMLVLARGASHTNVHFARLIAGVQKAGLDVHDAARASGTADVFRL